MVREPLKAAIEDMKVITSLIGENSKLEEKFRTRMRSLSSLINEVGIVPTLSFCYGKAGENVYRQVKDHFYKNEKIGERNEEERNEKVSYALYLFIALNYLKELGLISQTDHVIDALNQLLFGKCEIASKLLQPYLLQLKILTEALFESKSENI